MRKLRKKEEALFIFHNTFASLEQECNKGNWRGKKEKAEA